MITFFYSDQISDKIKFHFRHDLLHEVYMEGRKDGLIMNQQFYENNINKLTAKYEMKIESLKTDLETLKKRIKK